MCVCVCMCTCVRVPFVWNPWNKVLFIPEWWCLARSWLELLHCVLTSPRVIGVRLSTPVLPHSGNRNSFPDVPKRTELQGLASARSQGYTYWQGLSVLQSLHRVREQSACTHQHDWQPHSAFRSHPLGTSSWRSCGELKPFLWTSLKQEKVAGRRHSEEKDKGKVYGQREALAGQACDLFSCASLGAVTIALCPTQMPCHLHERIVLPLWIL